MSEPNPTQDMILSTFERLQSAVADKQEILWTFFMPTREVKMFMGRLGFGERGLVRFQGEDQDDKPVILVMDERHLSFMLEIVGTEKQPRIGFSLD